MNTCMFISIHAVHTWTLNYMYSWACPTPWYNQWNRRYLAANKTVSDCKHVGKSSQNSLLWGTMYLQDSTALMQMEGLKKARVWLRISTRVIDEKCFYSETSMTTKLIFKMEQKQSVFSTSSTHLTHIYNSSWKPNDNEINFLDMTM